MIGFTSRSSLPALLALLVAAALLVMTFGAPGARSASYRSCSLSERDRQPSGGKPTYNLSLKQRSSSCRTAKRVMNAFHACRARTSYRCTRKVLTNWTCSARKTSSIETTFYATFTCSWGDRRVKSNFQQNT